MDAATMRVTDPTSSIELARQLHDTIAQRLTGLSCYLGEPDESVPEDAIDRCRDEIRVAIAELREALDGVGRTRPQQRGRVDSELTALRELFPGLQPEWRWAHDVDHDAVALIDSFLVESLCNVRKHAVPTRVVIEARHCGDAVVVTVTNDGVLPEPGGGTRQGSRLLALEATAVGAVTESHPMEGGCWQQSLVMPWLVAVAA